MIICLNIRTSFENVNDKNMRQQPTPKETVYGRPRLLTHEAILRAAVEIGLEGLTMKRLATYLGVGTATLYQYFDSRKMLIRAAAVYALSDVPLPRDTGQSWIELSREYVQALQTLLAENPAFIHSQHHTDYGFEVQFQLIEGFLEAMARRHFSDELAMRLFNLLGMVAFAGAIELIRQWEFELEDEIMSDVAARQFARLDKAKFPHMSAAFDIFMQSPEVKTEMLLAAVFAQVKPELERKKTYAELSR